MKILFASMKLGAFGGVEQHIRSTALGLKERGHEVYLAYAERTGIDEIAFMRGFEEAYPLAELGSDDANAFALAQLLQKVQPDVLYLHKAEQLVMQLPPNLPCAVVAMIHDHDLCCPRRHKYFPGGKKVCKQAAGWRCWLDGSFLKKDGSAKYGVRWNSLKDHRKQLQAHRGLDGLIAASTAMKDELIMNGIPADKVMQVAPGIGETAPEKPAAIDIELRPKVLFVGQLIRGKGVDLLLHALAKIDLPFEAVIVGDGNAREGLETLAAELELQNRAHFTGWVTHDQLHQYYSDSRVVVVPSRWPEPFGLIGPEAMRAGRPVVAYDVGGIPDWLQDKKTGFLVAEQDTDAFANAVRELLYNPDLAREFGNNAFEQYSNRFMLKHGVERLEAALQQVCEQRRKVA